MKPEKETRIASITRRDLLASALATGLGLSALPGHAQTAAPEPAVSRIHLNQVGYLPEEPKRAVVPPAKPGAGKAFQVIEEQNSTVHHSGELAPPKGPGADTHSGDRIADFSALRRPGRYRLRLEDGTLSPVFLIGSAAYADLIPLITGFFSIQQCGPQTSPKRKPCHPDDGIARGGPRDGQRIDAAGGWHDAGDYLKFVETNSYATALMLFACDLRPHLATSPGGARSLSPLLAQAKVGLDWLLKMHPSPQEFYYQVGEESDHNRWRLPEIDNTTDFPEWQPRPVLSGVGANLAGRTAASFAMASRLYKASDPAFAARCLAAAQSVYALGLKNPQALSTQPHDFYPEESSDDDMEWGAAELFRATRKAEYLQQALAFAKGRDMTGDHVSVYNTSALAHFALYPHASPEDRETLLGYLQADADRLHRSMRGPYGLASSYVWGTAEAATGAALTCLLYAKLSDDKAAADVARRQRDYIFGCNPFGLSFLIGAGTRNPQNPHHQIADLGKFPIQGAMIAGPTSLKTFQEQNFKPDGLQYSVPTEQVSALNPAEVGVYQDTMEDYITNEPAIDYTAQTLLLAAFYLPSK